MKSPIVTMSAQDYETFLKTGIGLVRVQSQVVGIIHPLGPIPFKRGAPAEVIRDEYLKWRKEHES